MTTKAKICGLSTPETVKTAFDGGAAYLGFVFFARSPRNVEPETAQRLVEPVRGRGVATVAVTVDPDDALVDRLMATMRPDLIQVHGKETPTRVREIAQRSGVGVIKAFSVSTAADVDQALAYETVAEQFLFDARPVEGQGGTSSLPGGTGARFDWSLLEGRRFSRPHFLAGGLDPWNVGAAVAASGAPLVDVSSGVERGPGLKDPALITAFLDAVKRA
ncbi:phosphoribosylanthranilate isomerase [Caulobacter flavus]|uniref:N-(5'-phosphoribosyl)anthranilate isomerase n=1 Tax=Caulobacter flavus TaxID=1679497 RepID=A0A2N5CR90_9CAUL|nr:phosphoribosylanthranilate isomerase [Caulobacter flavus]AYV46091.1 phosphoribosylanthranilate isomerase [Caulobacter flavus]PLR11256.1 phosphoribosylanthranilate isomerase [Caulobacter flavus]